MKCPKCSIKQKNKKSSKCSECGYVFRLDPKKGLRLSDHDWLMLLEKATGQGRHYITENQLYAAFYRRYVKQGRFVKVILAMMLIYLIFLIFDGVITAVLIFIVIINLFSRISNKAGPSRERFQKSIITMKRALPTEKLRYLVSTCQLMKRPTNNPEDVYNYGVERLLIVERDILVDLLVFNGWHAENKTLVISGEGYPKYLLPMAQKLLRDTPDLPVYLLHDAGEQGQKMMSNLQADSRFPLKGHPITDLGLTRRDALRSRMLSPFSPKKRKALPVDFLLFGSLSAALSTSIINGLAFSDMLDPKSAIANSYGSDFG